MHTLKEYPINLHEMYKARKIISEFMKPSPLIKYDSLSNQLGFEAYIKHENQNITGSFKIRGGINIMSHLKERQVSGVVTFSTGNHGLSVAASAKLFNLPSIVVVPVGANPTKIDLIKRAGAEVIEAGRNFDEASEVVFEINKTKGYYYIHPANEPLLVNGVGTEFLEILDEIPDLDAIILPLGGGSEVASAVVALKSIAPHVSIYAVQAELSCAAYQSWCRNEIVSSSNHTFAGGFATGTAYKTTFDLYRDKLDDFILLSEEEIVQGIALAAFHTKNIVEGAGSSTIMAAAKLREELAGKKVVLQFSGANPSDSEIKLASKLSCFYDGLIM